jgi:hypothetical protein
VDLPVLLPASEHAGRRPGDPHRERGRRARVRHTGGLRPLRGIHPAGAVPVDRGHDRSRLRAADRAGAGRPGHLLPRRRRHRLRRERQSAASTGDDTNPFQSDGYAPIDERPGRNPAFDAQRTSANTNDLRGKVLRITVNEDGSYSIPEGNLFVDDEPAHPPGDLPHGPAQPVPDRVQPGHRRAACGRLLAGCVDTKPASRPGRQGKWMVVTEPGNYGWPYCATAELPCVDYDFATGASSELLLCFASRAL